MKSAKQGSSQEWMELKIKKDEIVWDEILMRECWNEYFMMIMGILSWRVVGKQML